jgi:Flp pilus assembly protein TadB
MAGRPKLIGNKIVLAIVGVAAASLTGFVMWGPIAGALVAVLAIVGVFVYAWRRKVNEARVTRTADNFSFAEVAVRMRAKDRAHELLLAKRATAVLEPSVTGSG